MMRLMEILKIYLEEELLIKYCVIKHLILLKILNVMDIHVDLLQRSIIFFDKKTSSGAIKNENIPNKKLAEELHKPFIRKSNKGKVHSSFIDNNRACRSH